MFIVILKQRMSICLCLAFGDMDVETLNRLLQRLPDDIGNLSIRDIVTRSTK